MKKALSSLLLLLAGFLVIPLRAQDGHYWTQQYGTKSMLLGGAVIGGVEDLGAVFYNPARLAILENPGFLLSADVYEWQRLRVTNATDETGEMSNSNFGGIPSLVAGSFTLGFLEGHRFAYAIMERSRSDFDFSFDDEVFGDVLPGFSGEEHFRAATVFRQELREDWASLSWSMPLDGRYSVGVTTSVFRYNQRRGNELDLHAYNPSVGTALFTYHRKYRVERYGLLWKLGLAAEYQRVSLGLTLTTPAIGVYGSGRYNLQSFGTNIPDVEDLYLSTDQKDLATKYRRPWSVGAGATFLFPRGKLHLSGEWFSRVPYYELLQAEDHLGQSDGETYTFTLFDELRSTVNGGVGLEYYLKEKVSLFGSFATDWSVVPSDRTGFSEREPVAASSVFSTDLFHLGGGFILKLKGIDLTLGVTHTGGKESFRAPLDFPEEGEDEPVLPEDETGTFHWNRWRFVFAFQVPFLEEKIRQLEDRF